MKIAITGAAGYIGSALAKRLSNQDLVLIDNYSAKYDSRPEIKEVEGHKIINGDLADIRVCEDRLRGVEIIYHFAALSGISRCENTESYYSNIIATSNVAVWAEKYEAKKIVFASTSAVYGESQNFYISETHRVKPRCRYGWQKYIGELTLQSLRVPTVIFRKSNVYGDGYFHKPVAVDIFIDRALEDKPITIDGTGSQRRDYVHLDDVLDAYTQAMFWDSGVYNIGGNDNLSVNELADLVSKVAEKYGKSTKKVFNEKAEVGRVLRRFTYDFSKAKGFGYSPKRKVEDEVRRRFESHLHKTQ